MKKLFIILISLFLSTSVFAKHLPSKTQKPFKITAKSWILSSEGKTLRGENTTEVRSIGSITKLVTAMVYLDEYKRIRTKGEQDLFSRMIIRSDNNASKILCDMVPNCVTLMNLKARELGLTNTKFVEPSGLSVFNISNAEELVKIVEASSYYPEIVEASQTAKRNTNPTIDKYNYIISKTGYIRLSGGCIVAKVDDKIIVILGSKNVRTRITELEYLIKH